MKEKTIYLVWVLLLPGCSHEVPAPPPCRQQHSESDSLYLASDFTFGQHIRFADSTISMPAVSSYDTVFWYRGSGWRMFDHLCALYNRNDRWYSDLVYQPDMLKRVCIKTTREIDKKRVDEFRSMLDSFNTRCKPVLIDTIGRNYTIDAPHYNFLIKEGPDLRCFSWGSQCFPCEQSTRPPVLEMRFLMARLLMGSGYPEPKLFCYAQTFSDSITIEYYLNDRTQVKNARFIFNNQELIADESLNLPKSRAAEIKNLRAEVTLLNGDTLKLSPVISK